MDHSRTGFKKGRGPVRRLFLTGWLRHGIALFRVAAAEWKRGLFEVHDR